MGGNAAYLSLLASSGITLHRGNELSFLFSDSSTAELRLIIAAASKLQSAGVAEDHHRLAGFIADARKQSGKTIILSSSPNASKNIREWFRQWGERTSPLYSLSIKELVSSATINPVPYAVQELQKLADLLVEAGFKVKQISSATNRAPVRDSLPLVLFEAQGDNQQILGAGCAVDDLLAKTRAVGETIERIVARNSVPENVLCETAIALNHAGLETPQVHLDARDAFSENTVIDWTPGWTLDERPAALPAELAYFDYIPLSGVRAFALQHTTGLASGPTIEAAVWRGLCEVFERDAYWTVMRCKLNCPTISPSVLPPSIKTLLFELASCGVEVVLKDISLDRPIKIIHAIFIQRDGRLPAFSHGVGSHVDVGQAALKAITECSQLHAALAEYSQSDLPGILLPSKNPKRFDAVWCDPASRSVFSHLIDESLNGSVHCQKGASPPLADYLGEHAGEIFWSLLGRWNGINVVRVLVPDATPPNREPSYVSGRLKNWLDRCGLRFPYDTPILT